MKFIKKIKNVFIPQQAETLEGVSIQPGESVGVFSGEGAFYGACGVVSLLQVDSSRPIEFQDTNRIRGRTQLAVYLDDWAW